VASHRLAVIKSEPTEGHAMIHDRFKLPPTATKAELIEKYNQLLDVYAQKVAEVREASKRRPATEARADVAATEVARGASVDSVLDAVGALRGLVGRTLNDLTDRMAAEAERLEQLRRAADLEAARLELSARRPTTSTRATGRASSTRTRTRKSRPASIERCAKSRSPSKRRSARARLP